MSTFSPDGRIFQVEYAGKAIEVSGTAVGIRCTDGVLLGVEKLVAAPMLVEGTGRRVAAIEKHVGAAVAGWYPDGRMLISRAREEAAAYRAAYGDAVPPRMLAERMGAYTHVGTVAWYMRPAGAAMLLAGYDSEAKRPGAWRSSPSLMRVNT